MVYSLGRALCAGMSIKMSFSSQAITDLSLPLCFLVFIFFFPSSSTIMISFIHLLGVSLIILYILMSGKPSLAVFKASLYYAHFQHKSFVKMLVVNCAKRENYFLHFFLITSEIEKKPVIKMVLCVK